MTLFQLYWFICYCLIFGMMLDEEKEFKSYQYLLIYFFSFILTPIYLGWALNRFLNKP